MMTNELQYLSILPELNLSLFGMLIMVLDPLMADRASRKPLGWLAFLGTLVALGATFYQGAHPVAGAAFFGMVRTDAFSIFFHVVVIAIAALAILTSLDYLDTQGIRSGEYYGLILMGTVGMGLLSSAMEL